MTVSPPAGALRLRTTILLGSFGLVLGLVAATVLLLSGLLERAARRELGADLTRGRVVFEESHALRGSLYRSEALTIAQEPRLKAVLGTADIDRPTILDVADDMKKAGGVDLFLLLDAEGRLVVDLAEPEAAGFDLSRRPLVAGALRVGDADDMWTDARLVYQVHAHRLGFGDTVIGVLVLGHLYDERVVAALQRQTGSGVVLALDGAAAAHGLDEPGLAEALAALASGLGAEVEEREVLGGRYLLQRLDLPGYTGERALVGVLVESLDAALATSRTLTAWLYALAGLALLLAALSAWALARRLSRPIDRLVELARTLATGQLEARAAVEGPVEARALARAMNDMAGELARSRVLLAAQQRLERELEIAARIQTSILPRDVRVPGLEIAAAMRPASEVGGDYYDVLPQPSGDCWLGIGDVAGHGLTAGLVMLMVQSLIAVLVQEHPDGRPAQLLPPLNAMLHKNIRDRLRQDEHVTLTLLRVLPEGQVFFAGAHEDIVVCRAEGGPCERVPTPGTWLGVVPDVAPALRDSRLQLRPGDLLVLYTDGVTEAMSATREYYGLDRLCAALAARRGRPVAEICDEVLAEVAAWTDRQRDDVTLLLVRYRGPAAA